MKWGVRRYQNKDGSYTSQGKSHLRDRKIDKKIETYVKSGKAYVDNLPDYEVGSLNTMTTRTGEQYISGLTNGHDFDWQEVSWSDYSDEYVPVARQVKIGLSKFENQDEFEKKAHEGYDFYDTDIEKCNPGYGDPGTIQNCAKCAATLELRLRGIDVSAGRQTYPSSSDAQAYWFKDAKRVDYSYDTAEECLKSYGKNTSGTLSIRYPGNAGGHAVHWKNNSKGEFQITDGQNGNVFENLDDLMDAYGGDKSATIGTFRLDNCEPDYEHMASDSVVREVPYVGVNSKVYNRIDNRLVDTW